MKTKLSLIGLLITTALLSGCKSQPTDADLQAAETKNTQQQGGAQALKMFEKDIAQMKILACKEQGDNVYLCDIKGVFGPTTVKMVKSDDGWTLFGQAQ